jgi:hypothetical protein
MSTPTENNYSSQDEEYAVYEEQEENEFEEYKKEKLRKMRINPPISQLGDSINEKTLKSYKKLRKEIEDTPYLASRRPAERVKRNLKEMGKEPQITTIIRRVLRLRHKGSNKEYLVYDYEEQFTDLNGNSRILNYKKNGAHQEVAGITKRDARYNIIGSEITEWKIIFDIPFTKKNLEDILKKSNSEEKPEFTIGYCRTKGRLDTRPIYEDKTYAVKNLDDFKQGTFEELWALGERALSTSEPSLSKLSQPLSEDPPYSLQKRMKGYLSPDKISYAQTSYR